jgi:hypothetical protein
MVAFVDLAQGLADIPARPLAMKPPPEEPRPVKPPVKLTRSAEARRIIWEYVADLREIIKKLRRKLN